VGEPYISVIVPAYNRRKYLLGAVNSVLSQNFPRHLYEIIVVKNFRDEAIDSKLQEWGVVNLYSDHRGLGAKIVEALEVARGEVVSFLEDDDEFLPGKLQRVYSSFKAKGTLDFYHNRELFIDEAGNRLGKREYPESCQGYVSDAEKWRYLRAIENCPFKGNSFISIRRDVLLRRADVLKQLTPAVDEYCLSSAVLYGRDLLFDRAVLTAYRLHPDQSMFDQAGSRGWAFPAYARRTAERDLRFFQDYSLLLSTARGTPYEAVFRSLQAMSKLASYLYWSISSSMVPPDLVPNAGDYLALLRFAPGCRELRCFSVLYAFMAACASPKPMRRLAALHEFARNRGGLVVQGARRRGGSGTRDPCTDAN